MFSGAKMMQVQEPRQGLLILPPNRAALKGWIDEALAGGPSVKEFVNRLNLKGIITRVHTAASTGRLLDISFSSDGMDFKGCDLGQDYMVKGLLARGLVHRNEIPVRPEAGPDHQISAGEIMRRIIDLTLRQRPLSFQSFIEGLTERGLQPVLSLGTRGRLLGFHFNISGMGSFKCSDLGFDYSWPEIMKFGVEPYPGHSYLKVSSQMVGELNFHEVMEDWPDHFQGYSEANLGHQAIKEFIKAKDLLFWRKETATAFYHLGAGPRQERRGLAFVDYPERIEIRRASEINILKALKYASLKWTEIAVSGSQDFVRSVMESAKLNQIHLIVKSAV